MDGQKLNTQKLIGLIPAAVRRAFSGDLLCLREVKRLAVKVGKDKVGDALLGRVEEGIWCLHFTSGEQLGLSVIRAQEFYYFKEQWKAWLPKKVCLGIDAWADDASIVSLDREAVELIQLYTKKNTIPEKYLLANLVFPMTDFEMFLVDGLRSI